jgi:predicted dehydrogenase
MGSAIKNAKPRIGVIGTGWWATQHHIPALLAYPGAVLAGVADLDKERLDRAGTHFGIEARFDDPRKLMSREIVDGVIIATPHATHFELARQAFEAGLHVFVEKPLALKPADAWQLVETANSKGLHLTVGYTAQHSRSSQFLRSAVQGGELGSLLCISADVATMNEPFFRGLAEFHAEDYGVSVATPKVETYSDPSTAGGGQAQTQLTHTVGMILYVTGDTASSVTAVVRTTDLAVDLVDAVAFSLAGGAIGTICSTGTVRRQQRQRHEVRYYGTEGLAVQDIIAGEATVVTADGIETLVGPQTRLEPLPNRAPARAFADLIAGRGKNFAPGDCAARAVDFIAAVYQSANGGSPCWVEPARHTDVATGD